MCDFVTNEVVPRKKGESDQDYQKRVDEYNKKTEEFWTKEAMENSKPMKMPMHDPKAENKK
jgi:hypothetical protein